MGSSFVPFSHLSASADPPRSRKPWREGGPDEERWRLRRSRSRLAAGGGGGWGGGGGGNWRRSGSAAAKEQRLRLGAEELLESRLGFAPYTDGERRLGWLLTFSPVSSISISLSLFVAVVLGRVSNGAQLGIIGGAA